MRRTLLVMGCSMVAACAPTLQSAIADMRPVVLNGVRTRASFDLGCSEEKVVVRELDAVGSAFAAQGCGKKAAYLWRKGAAVLNSQVTTDESAPSVP